MHRRHMPRGCTETGQKVHSLIIIIIIIIALNIFLPHPSFQNMSITNNVEPVEHWHADAREICRVPNVCRNEAIHRRLECGVMCKLLLNGDYSNQHGMVGSAELTLRWDTSKEHEIFRELYVLPYRKHVAAHYPSALSFGVRRLPNTTAHAAAAAAAGVAIAVRI
jgi:hypothetical protein